MSDFIELVEDAVATRDCATIIEHFERSPSLRVGAVGSGIDKSLKDSTDLTISDHAEWRQVERLLNNAMMAGLLRYVRRYPQLLVSSLALRKHPPADSVGTLISAEELTHMDDAPLSDLIRGAFRPGSVNLQRYAPDTGGYPYWHCEIYPRDADCESLHRVLLWTVYLNDDFAGGETEFFFQQRTIQPRTGSLLFAPAGFTHTHRGNTPRSGPKYIATSWVLFRRAEQIFAAA